MPGLHRLLIQAIIDGDEQIRHQAFTDGFVSGAGAAMIVTLMVLVVYELWWKR